MKKNILLLLFLSLINIACEKDDFCTENPVTPNLVLRFYDTSDASALKSVERLSVVAQGRTDTLAAYTSITTDSIAIPLNSMENQTVYLLKMNNVDGNINNNQLATLTVSYTTEEEYVSRSCGFRIIYNDLTLVSDNSWIKSLTPETLTIINSQNSAHVQVFH